MNTPSEIINKELDYCYMHDITPKVIIMHPIMYVELKEEFKNIDVTFGNSAKLDKGMYYNDIEILTSNNLTKNEIRVY